MNRFVKTYKLSWNTKNIFAKSALFANVLWVINAYNLLVYVTASFIQNDLFDWLSDRHHLIDKILLRIRGKFMNRLHTMFWVYNAVGTITDRIVIKVVENCEKIVFQTGFSQFPFIWFSRFVAQIEKQTPLLIYLISTENAL